MISKLSLALFLILFACVSSQSQKHGNYSPVESTRSSSDFRQVANNGMVVTAHTLASDAGRDMLARGGNAIDAAVASSFVISVVRPQSTGLGGGGFLVFYDAKSKTSRSFDFRERAPLAATRDMFLDHSGEPRKITYNNHAISDPSINGHLSVAVPGLVKGLVEIHKELGKLPLKDVMAPAIRTATLGFRVYPTLAQALETRSDILALYPSTKAIFFENNRPLREGQLLVQKDLASTLTKIAELGDQAFYSGDIASMIVREMKRGGGLISHKDLTGYKMIERKPLTANYRDTKIIAMPPPSSGGLHIIQMLKMLEADDLKSLGESSPEAIHLTVESMRRAFADRTTYLADPDFVKIPINWLLSDAYLKSLRSTIKKDKASVSRDLRNPQAPPGESESTTHISVVDSGGNAVSTTQTINYLFGSCVVATGTGVLLNDEMDDFSTNPGAANVFGLIQGEGNAVQPKKTPLSSMSPTIVLDNRDQVKLVVGSPGGPRIISAMLLTMLRTLAYNESLLDAVHGLRYHHQWLPDEIHYEKNAFSDSTMQSLRNRGHKLTPISTIGEVQAILRHADGTIEGVSDSRAEGRPAGL
jgi:gamma-glutamyltranspeptidase/glutathione hydrolase